MKMYLYFLNNYKIGKNIQIQIPYLRKVKKWSRQYAKKIALNATTNQVIIATTVHYRNENKNNKRDSRSEFPFSDPSRVPSDHRSARAPVLCFNSARSAISHPHHTPRTPCSIVRSVAPPLFLHSDPSLIL